MSPPPVSFDIEQLLAQTSWVRALASRLAPDAHLAEDLAQDAMIIALRQRRPGGASPGSEPEALRRWLAAVVRNLGRTRHRSARRRVQREAALARGEASPSTLELVERVSVQRELVGAVLELDEPYRSTLLMRYYDDLSQRQIAERSGVPVSTVGTHIAEGIRRLRRKLRRRDAWLSSVATFYTRHENVRLPAVVTGALVMSAKAKLVLGCAVLVGAFFASRGLFTATPPLPGSGPAPAIASGHGPRSARPQLERVEAARGSATVGARGFDDIPAHARLERGVVRGTVIDVSGAPLTGIEVGCERPRGVADAGHRVVPATFLRSVLSGAGGRFELEGALPMQLEVRDDEYTTVFEGVVDELGDSDVVVVAARRIPLGGVVVDARGAPIGGVAVTVVATVTLRGRDLRSSSPVVPQATTDQLGAFAVKGAFAVEGARIEFRAPGFATAIRPSPVGGDPGMRVVLSRDGEGPCAIAGRAVLEDGSPAVGAYVSTGFMASRADDSGRFVIDFEPWLPRIDPDAPTVVTAILPGRLPASRTLPSVGRARMEGWPDGIVLALVGAPRTIEGTVVDEEGQPIAGLLVEPADMSDFGLVQSEGLPAYSGVPTTVELLAGGGVAYSGADGRFTVGGLLERPYTIRVLDRRSLLAVTTDPVDAGVHGLRIVVDRGSLGTIAGRIVDRHGKGIGGVRVAVSGQRTGELVIGRSARTDEDGAFRLTDVTTEPPFLRIEGEAIVPELFRELRAGDDVGALRLEVGRRCRVQFDWGDWPGRNDELRVVDRDGDPLMMMALTGRRIGERPSIGYQSGVTDVVVVSDAAAHVVVSRAGEEVTRLRLALRPDELNMVRL